MISERTYFFELSRDRFKRIVLSTDERALAVDAAVYDDLGCYRDEQKTAFDIYDVDLIDVHDTGVRITLKSTGAETFF